MKQHERMEQLKDDLDEARSVGDKSAEAAALYGIGGVYLKEGVDEAAEDFWGQCEAICRDGNQQNELAQVLVDLGDLALKQDNPDLARERYKESLNLYKTLELLQGQARVLDRLGGMAAKQNDIAQALELYRQGLSLCRENDDRIGSLFFLDQIIPLLKTQGAHKEMDRAIRDSITLAEKLGDSDRMALGLLGLADLYQRAGETKEALPCLEMAHDIYLRLGKTKEAETVLNGIIEVGGQAPSNNVTP